MTSAAWAEIARKQETNPYYPFLNEPGEAGKAGVPVEYVRVCNTGCAKDAATVTAFWQAGVSAEWVKEIIPRNSDRVEQYIEAWKAGASAEFLRKLSFLIMSTRIRLWERGLREHHLSDLGMSATHPGALEAVVVGFPAKALAVYLEAGFDVEGAARLHDAGVSPEYAASCGDSWNAKRVLRLHRHGIPAEYAAAFGYKARVKDVSKMWDDGIPLEFVRAMR